MDEQGELQGWELLQPVDHLRPSAIDDDGGDPFGVFKVDYFVLEASAHGEEEGNGLEERALSELRDHDSVDPNPLPEQMVIGEDTDLAEGAAFPEDGLEKEMGLEDVNDLSWLDSWADETEGAGGGVKEVEVKRGVDEELGSISSLNTGNLNKGSVARDSGVACEGGAVGERSGIVWWKVPLELVSYCISRTRPVWSVSVAAVMLGLLILGRRFYKMRRASRRILVGLDEKKAFQIPAAAHLNDAFRVLQHAPAIKATIPTAGVTPWPAIALR